MALSKKWTKVTPFSKFLALLLFIALPVFAFYYGYYVGKASTRISLSDNTIIYKLISPKALNTTTCISNLQKVAPGQTCCQGLMPKVTNTGTRICASTKTS